MGSEKTVDININFDPGTSTAKIINVEAILKEKPQNFQRAQQQVKGKFQCYYDCEVYFNSPKEARQHFNCPCRRKCKETLDQMNIIMSYSPLTVVSSCTKQETKSFRKYLKRLPVMEKEELVRLYFQRANKTFEG